MKLSQIALIPILIQSSLGTISNTSDSLPMLDIDDAEIGSFPTVDEQISVIDVNECAEMENEDKTAYNGDTIATINDGLQLSIVNELHDDDADSNIDEVVFTPPTTPDLEYNENEFSRNEKQIKV